MVRKIMLILAAAVLAAGAFAPADASASRSKSRGARGFHGADVYFPADYGPPIFASGSVYCWHWFRIGRGWARAWAC